MPQKQSLFSSYKLIDLTHPLNSQVPTWSGSCGFNKFVKSDYSDYLSQTKFLVHRLEMRGGIGTHMDAPCHCIKGGMSIADFDIQEFFLPLIVLDVSSKADADYQIGVNDILAFERTYGTIPPNCLVIAYTGWSKYWNDPIKYRNVNTSGQVQFPSVNVETATELLRRGVSGLAIDTLSPDLGTDAHFPVHELFLGNSKYLVENIANAHLLPPTGAYGIVLPLNIQDGSEAPVRFIALVNK